MATKAQQATTSAIELLKADHEQVRQLFDKFEAQVQARTESRDKQQLVEQICSMLSVHTQMEEELLYPAARSAIKQPELVDEASVEHASAKDLITQIQGMSRSDPMYDATVKVLGEYVKHHVSEEEGEMFPQLQESGVDINELGRRLAARKQELLSQAQGQIAGLSR